MRCSITDFERVKRVLFHPRVAPLIFRNNYDTDKGERNLRQILKSKYVYVLMPNEFSVVIYFPQIPCETIYDGHTGVMPEGRGSLAIRAMRDSISWMFENTSCLKIITQTPAFHKPALWLARQVGFKQEGVNRKSIYKFGKLHDKIVFGIPREEWYG